MPIAHKCIFPFTANFSFTVYVHSSYLLTSIFRHAKQTRWMKNHQSQPTCMTFHFHRSDMKQTTDCIACGWLIFKQHFERWSKMMSKDSCYACNTESSSSWWNVTNPHQNFLKCTQLDINLLWNFILNPTEKAWHRL